MPPSTQIISTELQKQQRQRAWFIKSRNMVSNRLQATVAGLLCGYASNLPEAQRKKAFEDAEEIIKQVRDGTPDPTNGIITSTSTIVATWNKSISGIEKEMEKLAGTLPVAKWVKQPEQRGFGLLFLAIVVGETGDLANYHNPAKVWRRLGCAPWSYDDKTLMGATWKSGREGKLPAAEWEEFGYSPRRRSISYLIGNNIVKQNAGGPYRRRYDEAKVKVAAAHPDYKPMRCHLHGMLLATKLLLKNLWVEWNGHPPQDKKW